MTYPAPPLPLCSSHTGCAAPLTQLTHSSGPSHLLFLLPAMLFPWSHLLDHNSRVTFSGKPMRHTLSKISTPSPTSYPHFHFPNILFFLGILILMSALLMDMPHYLEKYILHKYLLNEYMNHETLMKNTTKKKVHIHMQVTLCTQCEQVHRTVTLQWFPKVQNLVQNAFLLKAS